MSEKENLEPRPVGPPVPVTVKVDPDGIVATGVGSEVHEKTREGDDEN